MGCFAMVCGREQQKCHEKETRIKREGKSEEKHKLGFLPSGMLNERRRWSATRNNVG